MRYVIIGAGAVGATIGGRLAERGRDVVFVARGAHGAALATDGLRLALPDRELHLTIPTTKLADLTVRTGDVLIVAAKSQDSQDILAALASKPVGPATAVGPDSAAAVEPDSATAGEVLPVFLAQNGVGNEDLALRFFADVHGVCVILPATHLEPGRVEASGSPLSGILHLGRYPAGSDKLDDLVAADLDDAGFAALTEADVMAWKRAKLLRNLANATEALFDQPVHLHPSATASPGVAQVRRRAMAEGRACFEAAGLSVVSDEAYRLPPGDQARPVAVGGRSRQGGSTWQSVQRGQGSVETDYLNGEIVRLGRLYGVPTPVNAALQNRMREIVRTGAKPGGLDPDTFLAELGLADLGLAEVDQSPS